jgi:hypothetical protein
LNFIFREFHFGRAGIGEDFRAATWEHCVITMMFTGMRFCHSPYLHIL